jgi:hypothetical protein
MHYTSVPNILKVLNPLFLDELRARLTAMTSFWNASISVAASRMIPSDWKSFSSSIQR